MAAGRCHSEVLLSTLVFSSHSDCFWSLAAVRVVIMIIIHALKSICGCLADKGSTFYTC